MKRLVRATSIALVAVILCLIGVTVTLNVNRRTLRTDATTQPTSKNTTKFTTEDHTYYGPANLVHRRAVLSLLFVFLLLILLSVLFTRSLLLTVAARRRRLEMLQTQQLREARPDFIVETGSVSWVIPKSLKWAVLRSPRGWLPFLIMVIVAWFILDFGFRLRPKPNSSPGMVATECAIVIAPGYFLIAFVILSWTSIVTLDNGGVTVQWAGKTGGRSVFRYRSITGCLIEPSRFVPSLPCLTFKAPGRVRSEQTVRLELPSSSNIPAVMKFLGAKGVVCADRR